MGEGENLAGFYFFFFLPAFLAAFFLAGFFLADLRPPFLADFFLAAFLAAFFFAGAFFLGAAAAGGAVAATATGSMGLPTCSPVPRANCSPIGDILFSWSELSVDEQRRIQHPEHHIMLFSIR